VAARPAVARAGKAKGASARDYIEARLWNWVRRAPLAPSTALVLCSVSIVAALLLGKMLRIGLGPNSPVLVPSTMY
jgi:hypothetical protein